MLTFCGDQLFIRGRDIIFFYTIKAITMNRDNGVVYKMLKFVKINGQAQLLDFPELSPEIAEWHFHYLIDNRLVSSVQSKYDDQYIITGLTTAGNMQLIEGTE
ncbi:hypothetical protein BV494_24760 (plasmid) [Rahnella sikkimica]|uniref:Uncharacterized protein n=2 Tax=Rahnella sikkimica TaxID=1805933 RepID=A0A2L1UYS5_9GAMM|nr:hypothetical protein BV494_24760 [Rahnella sikkimica]